MHSPALNAKISDNVKQNGSLTQGSGFQEPIGGSGGMGDPSSNKQQSETWILGSELRIICAVSFALVIVDLTNLVYGRASSCSLRPVSFACFLPANKNTLKVYYSKICLNLILPYQKISLVPRTERGKHHEIAFNKLQLFNAVT
jgi:hypothetical protein